MSLKTKFFNGAEYSALDWGEYFAPLYSNGVLNTLKAGETEATALMVTKATGMAVKVADGVMFINGYQLQSISTQLNLEITSATTRIDRIVARLDLGTLPQGITLYVKQGTSSAPPNLERTTNIYEMSLATISIPSGSASLANATITDDRPNADLCGISGFYGGNSYTTPPGTIVAYAGLTAPQGWIICDGRFLYRTTYGRLFNVIGTTYGNIDNNTFNVPDLRGEFIRGLDNGRGVDNGRVLGSWQEGQSDTKDNVYGGGGSTSATPHHYTRDTMKEVRPRNVALNYIIKY